MLLLGILGCGSIDLTFQLEAPLPPSTQSAGGASSGETESIFVEGDALTLTGVNGFAPSEFVEQPTEMVEWIDAAILSEDVGVLAGQGGFATVSLSNGEILGRGIQFRYYHVAVGDGLGVFSQKGGSTDVWDLSNPSNPAQTFSLPNTAHVPVDVAIGGGNILIASREDGTMVYDYTGTYRQTIPAETESVAVDIADDWIVICDGAVLQLYDTQYVLRSEIALAGVAKNVDIDQNRVAVALGGAGVQTFQIEEGELLSHGQAQPSGTVFSVSLDEDWLWMGAWSSVALGYLGGDSLMLVSREKTLDSAMGVAAINGKAIVADWFFSVSMLHHREYSGAAAVLPVSMSFPESDATSQFLRVSNEGGMPLSFEITSISDGFTVEGETVLSVPVGEQSGFWVTSPSQSWSTGYAEWKSNDPDAPTGRVQFVSASAGVGSLHPDFSLPTIQWPDGSLQTSRLSDFEDKVVFLAFWAGY